MYFNYMTDNGLATHSIDQELFIQLKNSSKYSFDFLNIWLRCGRCCIARLVMSLQFQATTQDSQVENNFDLAQQLTNPVPQTEHKIEVRELDKRYTHANPKQGKCNMPDCNNVATHWLTRQSKNYCQSDMICNQHAILWQQVKDLLE